MKRYVDHDQIAEKNKHLAQADEMNSHDKKMEAKGYNYRERQQEASCFNCKMKQKCPEFRAKRTGGSAGVVSFGGDYSFICSKYAPAPAESKGMSDKQVKSLLKNAMKGIR
jgi:hypothetical protein